MDRPEKPTGVRLASISDMYTTVLSVGLVCSLAIATVYELTRPIIHRNRAAFRQQAVLAVLPGSAKSIAFGQAEDGTFKPVAAAQESTELIFAGYDHAGHLVGLAIQAEGRGYQDVISLLYGYSFESQSILAIHVLQSRETPGLGDRIETDPDFQSNFGDLDVRVNQSGDAIAHPIGLVKAGSKKAAWEIDGISGATVTSGAVAEMLRKSTQRWVPRVFARRNDFTLPPTDSSP